MIFGVLLWSQRENSRVAEEAFFSNSAQQARQAELEARKSALNLLTSVQSDTTFDAQKNYFYDAAEQQFHRYPGVDISSDGKFMQSYNVMRRSYVKIAQCSAADLCDSKVLCDAIGEGS